MEPRHDMTVYEEIWAKTIGRQVLEFVKGQGTEQINRQADRDAVAALAEIKAILDDDKMDDPECFRRIEAIVDALDSTGVSTGRHDW